MSEIDKNLLSALGMNLAQSARIIEKTRQALSNKIHKADPIVYFKPHEVFCLTYAAADSGIDISNDVFELIEENWGHHFQESYGVSFREHFDFARGIARGIVRPFDVFSQKEPSEIICVFPNYTELVSGRFRPLLKELDSYLGNFNGRLVCLSNDERDAEDLWYRYNTGNSKLLESYYFEKPLPIFLNQILFKDKKGCLGGLTLTKESSTSEVPSCEVERLWVLYEDILDSNIGSRTPMNQVFAELTYT